MTKEPMTIPRINYLSMLFLMIKILDIFLIGLLKMLKFRNLKKKIRNNHLNSFLIRISSILKNSLSKNRKKKNKKKKNKFCLLKFTEAKKYNWDKTATHNLLPPKLIPKQQKKQG